MRSFFLILSLLTMPALAAPVPHAVLNPSLTLIDHYENIDAGLVSQYRADPSKAAKVERYRLLIVPDKPQATLQQIVEPFGTNVNDGGFTLTATDVTQVWRVRNLTAQEVTARNADTASSVSSDLTEHVTKNHWEQGFLRLDYLQSEALYYLFKSVVGGNLQTNLTVPERQRANTVSNELMNIYKLWKQGQTNYNFVLTNSVVVVPPTNWPNIVIGE